MSTRTLSTTTKTSTTTTSTFTNTEIEVVVTTFVGPPTTHPLLLLPVRVEARFAAGDELLIRVFPDLIHLAPDDSEAEGGMSAAVHLMPDRWIAWGWRGETRYQAGGSDITGPLRVTPIHPDTPQADRWLVDFAEAEAQGMAFRMTLDSATRAAGLDRLIVFGAAGELDATASAAAVEALLQAHADRGALAVAPSDTPTNRSADDPPPDGAARSARMDEVVQAAIQADDALQPPSKVMLAYDALRDLKAAITKDGAVDAILTAAAAAEQRIGDVFKPGPPPSGGWPNPSVTTELLLWAAYQGLYRVRDEQTLAETLFAFARSLSPEQIAELTANVTPGTGHAISPILQLVAQVATHAPVLQAKLLAIVDQLAQITDNAQANAYARGALDEAYAEASGGNEARTLTFRSVGCLLDIYGAVAEAQPLDLPKSQWQWALQQIPLLDPADAPWLLLPLDDWMGELQAMEDAANPPPTPDPVVPPPPITADSQGARLGWALGVDAQLFLGVPQAEEEVEPLAAAMNAVVWPSTGAYFLRQMMGTMTNHSFRISTATERLVRRHFVDHVRAGGPLPTLQVGAQPYGLLPVVETASGAWSDLEGDPINAQVLDHANALRPCWASAAEGLPRMRAGDDADELAQVLRRLPRSQSWQTRSALGRAYLKNLLHHVGLPSLDGVYSSAQATGWFSDRLVENSQTLFDIGVPMGEFLTSAPRIAGVQHTHPADDLAAPLVSPPVVDGDTLPAGGLTQFIFTSLDDAEAGPAPASLLDALVRQSSLMEAGDAARGLYRQLNPSGESQGYQDFWENETLTASKVDSEFNIHSVWRLLNVDWGNQGTIYKDWIDTWLSSGTGPYGAHVLSLIELAEAVGTLEAAHVASLERLVSETLDLCSYRLDAWLTAAANRRLRWMRDTHCAGLFYGAFGWLEDLRPSDDRQPDGYVHAPSLNQAATAAILRSAYLAHRDEDGAPMAVDLSSRRVREALRLLEGARQGQRLGALLGYELERRLEDAGLQQWIHDLRAHAPLDGQPSPAGAAGPVADGLALATAWATGEVEQAEITENLSPAPDPNTGPALEAVMGELVASVDGLADLLLAEGVHQAVLGNPERASASLEALASGAPPPAEIDLVRTPRGGLVLEHRLLALQSADPAAPTTASGLDEADPFVSAWAAQALGELSAVTFEVTWLDVARVAQGSETLSAADLGLSALELVALLNPDADNPGAPWAAWLAATRAPPTPQAPTPLVHFGLPSGAPASQRSLEDLVDQASALREALNRSRPLEVGDLISVEDTTAATRRSLVEEALVADLSALAQGHVDALALLLGAPLDAPALRAALLAVARLALPAAIPSLVDGELEEQAAAAVATLNQRLRGHNLAETPEASLQALLGLPFLGGSVISLDADALAQIFSVPDAAGLDSALQARGQLAELARALPGAAALDELLLQGEVLGLDAPSFAVGQSPFVPGESWVGLPMAARPADRRSSALALCVGAPDWALGALTGRVLEAWTESLPATHQTTGVAFQYDRPSQEPPQAALLALPAGAASAWTAEAVHDVIVEALSLAKLRMTDLMDVPPVWQFLPATYMPFNVQGATASFDPRFTP
ncbi:MAG: hypothetical protein H6741_27280 [Alphaproteobacteria bacterium]|nr:hypothetical protein [Alphaproteobacteria bacterium]